MDLTSAFLDLAIALGLGLLVGLQRERVATRLAGLRTFPLITVLGTLAALLAQSTGPWFLATSLGALAAVIVTANLLASRAGEADPAVTTQVAALTMFCVGAYLVTGHHEVAIAVGSGVAVLLYFKGELHRVAARLGENDLRAIMQLVLVSLVVLPALPNETYGPYHVLNPRQIWLMVVLIVGISLVAYLGGKFVGQSGGLLVGGLLGGIVSSTATTASYARRSAGVAASASYAAVAILTASAVVMLRILLEIFVVSPALLRTVSRPLLILFVLLAALAGAAWVSDRSIRSEFPPQDNPAELRWALLFALGYAVVLFAAAAAKDFLGDRGVYFVALLSGLTDVDAITLSTAQLVNHERLAGETGWRVIVLACLANLIGKAALVAILGQRQLFRIVSLSFAVVIVAGLLLIGFW